MFLQCGQYGSLSDVMLGDSCCVGDRWRSYAYKQYRLEEPDAMVGPVIEVASVIDGSGSTLSRHVSTVVLTGLLLRTWEDLDRGSSCFTRAVEVEPGPVVLLGRVNVRDDAYDCACEGAYDGA